MPWSHPTLTTAAPFCLESPTNSFTDFNSFRTLLPRSLHKPKLFITLLLPISWIFSFRPYTPSHSLQISSAGLLLVRDFNLTIMGGRAFFHTVPRLWNSLPLHIRQLNTIQICPQNSPFKLVYPF
ncbi:hypothetical protein LDENG_00224020 [Lucifuga dentata]|nr:hypothetical protein LDENG_00224020 [Lucifuga dentata]